MFRTAERTFTTAEYTFHTAEYRMTAAGKENEIACPEPSKQAMLKHSSANLDYFTVRWKQPCFTSYLI